MATAAGTLRLSLFGAPFDTGNRGVEALGRSVVSAVGRGRPGSTITVFDNGWGIRPGPQVPGVEVELSGVRHSRRYHRPEAWANVRVSQRLGGLRNPVARAIARSDAVLDISGGDSFSDIYGPSRFVTVMAPKRAALQAGVPLVLLPQTYGPFTDSGSRAAARAVVRSARLAFSRDAHSHDVLLDLLGHDADDRRHLRGVDVAFALPPQQPGQGRSPWYDSLTSPRSATVVGVNVSGLLWNADPSDNRFGLSLSYRSLVTNVVQRLTHEGATVLLVSHVRDVAHGRESDSDAASELLASMPSGVARRVALVSDQLSASELKWVISRCDWFFGTRMHSTIAALSSGVPTTAIAYSDKYTGVFRSCGVEGEVVDARRTVTTEAVARVIDAFTRRQAVRRVLTERAPAVVKRAEDQIEKVWEELDPAGSVGGQR